MPLSLDTPLPVLPEKGARAFLLKAPAADEPALLKAARSFGLSGREKAGGISKSPSALRYTEGPHVVQLHRASGGLRFYNTHLWQYDDGVSNLELSDRQAVAAAEKFIRNHALARPNEYQLLRVTRLHVASGDVERGAIDERVIDAGVAFQRVVDGIPVDGPGGKLIVYLDHQRNVTGSEKLWRPLGAPRPRAQLQPPERVLDRLRRKYAEGNVELEAFRFGYFELDWDAGQKVLQPAYVAILALTGPDRTLRIRKVEIVPALLKPEPGLTVPAKKPTKQPGRRD